jgi:hypothetical protein
MHGVLPMIGLALHNPNKKTIARRAELAMIHPSRACADYMPGSAG